MGATVWVLVDARCFSRFTRKRMWKEMFVLDVDVVAEPATDKVDEMIVGEEVDLSDWDDLSQFEWVDRCPACGDVMDYCVGHGPIGDPVGFHVLGLHEVDNHKLCHPAAEC